MPDTSDYNLPVTDAADHPDRNFDHVHEQSVAIDAMTNEYRNKPNANLRMRELGSMRSSLAKERNK